MNKKWSEILEQPFKLLPKEHEWVLPTMADYDEVNSMSNSVNHPSHYQGKVEVIDAIEAWELGFNLGNTVKYVARAGKKDPAKTIEDLEKGLWYLKREIERLKK